MFEGESFLRKFVFALALCICGPAFAQEVSVPFGQGGSRVTNGKAVSHQVILDARMYVSIPIDRAGTVTIEGLTETFDGVRCADPDSTRHAWAGPSTSSRLSSRRTAGTLPKASLC